MFRRRMRQPFRARVREFLWPRSGWRRWAAYLGHRVRRMPGTPHRIAAGLAAGAAVSCAPLPGVHFLLAVLLALATRGSPLASAIGTAFGNPWTFPILWGAAHRLGDAMLPSAGGAGSAGEADVGGLAAALTQAFLSFDPAVVSERLLPVWYPAMVGSLPIGLAVWILVYLLARRAVESHRSQRTVRMNRKFFEMDRKSEQAGD
ncbi:DUF2062 domain-containing protein [Azospirillum thermophilum]|nr:DUF2062 domain-containing protein [Azospirillum thermophilum]